MKTWRVKSGRLQVGGVYRYPGELVPEAEHWKNRILYVNTGRIEAVEVDDPAASPGPAEPKVVMRHIVGPGVVEDLTTGERRPYEATMTIDLDTAPPEVVEHVKANPKLYKPAPQAKRGKRK